MAGALVQSFGNNTSSNVTTISVDVNTTGATENNLLFATISIEGEIASSIAATGWTQLQEYYPTTANDLYACGAIFWRTATNTAADDFDPTWTGAQAASATVDEYSGLAVGAPEQSGENTTYTETEQDTGLAINSGSATPDTANGIAIAAYMGPLEFDASTVELEISDSYTRSSFQSANSSNPVAALAYKLYTTTAAQSPDWTSTKGGNWRGYGAIAVFKEAGGGGTTVTGTLETLTFTEYAATVTAETETNVTGTLETLTFTEYQATVSLGKTVTGTLETLTLTEYPATVNAETSVTGTLETLTFTEYPAEITEGAATNVTGTLETLTFTKYPGVVTYTQAIYATLETLTLTTFKADVSYTSLEGDAYTGGWDYPQRPDAKEERIRMGIIEPDKVIKPVKSAKKIPTEFKRIKSLEQAEAQERELQELQRIHETIKRRGIKKAQKEQLDKEVLIKITLALNELEQQKQLIEEQDIVFVMMMLAA